MVKEMADLVVVKAKIKDYTGDCNVAGDFAEALSAKAVALIQAACERARANNRKTVMAKDL